MQRTDEAVRIDNRVLAQIFDALSYLRGTNMPRIPFEKDPILTNGQTPFAHPLVRRSQAVLRLTCQWSCTANQLAKQDHSLVVIAAGSKDLGQLQAGKILVGSGFGKIVTKTFRLFEITTEPRSGTGQVPLTAVQGTQFTHSSGGNRRRRQSGRRLSQLQEQTDGGTEVVALPQGNGLAQPRLVQHG